MAIDGLLVPMSKLPYHVLQDMESATVVMRSSTASYADLEFPDHIEVRAEGLMLILDPKPTLTEIFKITIS